MKYCTVDDVKDDEENGDGSADDGQGDQDTAEKIFANASTFTTAGTFAIASRVLRHRFHRDRVQFLRTLHKNNIVQSSI